MFRKLRQAIVHWSRRRKMILGALLIMCLGLLGGIMWVFYDLPSIDSLQNGLALPSTRIYDRNGKLLYEILPPEQGRNTVVALDTIPQNCRNAVVATEDANFYNHPGVDPVGIIRALWINLSGGEVISGGSTITQQVARLLLLDPQQRAERTLHRKLREMALALQLQSRYSKDEVLALYLNQAYFGNLAYGIEAAARAYFGKGVDSLSLAECSLLAGLLQSPAAYDPLTNLEGAQNRQDVVLNLMVQHGTVTQAQADVARNDELQFASSPFPIQAPHFVMAVWTQLERLYPDRLYREGLEVTTTLDLDWQEAAQTTVQRQLARLNDQDVPSNANNAAVVAMNPYTGEVLTMLGSPDYFDPTIDGAVNAALALRQPGSALKPFTYAAAMNPLLPEPWTAATVVLDVKTPFVTRRLEPYLPANYGFREHGPVSVREALSSSYNIPAVVALESVGIERMVQLASNAGLTTLAISSQVDLAVTLGGGEVQLLDLTQAYSIFPNGGYRVEPVMITRVKVRDTGESLYQWQPPRLTNRVIDERVAFLISDILSDSEARAEEFGRVSALDLARPAAAKTGTTTDFRDNWTVGYTPNLVVGVWVGNANNTPMVDVTGVSGAAPIWNEFMRRVLVGQPQTEFHRPADLERVEVCTISGLLPTPACALRKSEWFIPGTAPTEYDNVYQVIDIDRQTGLPADESTPPERRMPQAFVVLPPEAQAWGRANGLRLLPEGVEVAMSDGSAPTANNNLRILSPAPYITYQLDPTQPADAQRIKWSAAASTNIRSVTFTLNGETAATVETRNGQAFEIWWPLEVGEYELVAVAQLADGTSQTSAPITFSVVDYVPPSERLPEVP
jgi:1A family penicillin-binding protein